MANLQTVGTVIAIAVAVVLLAAIVFVQFNRRNRVDSAPPPIPERTRRPIEPTAPMTGLESALAQTTDRAGRPLQDRLTDESAVVDDLRVPDDTGPILRRALDHVVPNEPDDDAPANP